MSGAERMQKLRWMCRRGMKELDTLLESFLSRHQHALQAGDWPQFERLLRCEDDLLWDWLSGSVAPDDRSFEPLIAVIRNTASART